MFRVNLWRKYALARWQDVDLYRAVELPFVPYPGLHLVGNEDEDAINVQIQQVIYNMQEDAFDALEVIERFARYGSKEPMPVFKELREDVEGLVVHGWHLCNGQDWARLKTEHGVTP